MYKIIDEAGMYFTLYQYPKEEEYEHMVVKNAEAIFGSKGIYFDIKKLIGQPKKGAAIPDGYYLDLTFHNEPTLYFVEVELSSHDVFGHIGEQVLRFAISSETDKHKIKTILITEIKNDPIKQKKLDAYFQNSKYNNINELLDKVIFDKAVSVIIVINEASVELDRVLAQLTISTEVIEAQTYFCGDKKLYRFTPFKDEVVSDLPKTIDADELDTIVVPAREDGFVEEFLNNDRWYAIRISGAMLDKIKYIAAYQVAPVSGITHTAEVDRIEKYKDTNKYILYFKKGTMKEITKVPLTGGKTGKAPQAPRYSSYCKILSAKSLNDLWK